MNQHIQNEKDLEGLIGQYETMRLDFKSSRLLGPDKSKRQISEDLAREVSAFANTEGGALVIGIETGRDAEKAMAVALSEGVDQNLIEPEWLQKVVASHLNPPLNGLVVRRIPLSGTRTGRVAYVIEVPKSETVHQAPDLKYYGRHELESKPMADNDIRLRMNRGRSPHAVIEPASVTRMTAEDEFSNRQGQLARMAATEGSEQEEAEREGEVRIVPRVRQSKIDEERKRLKAPKRPFDEYTFELAIRNDGPITIRDCSLALVAHAGPEAKFAPKPTGERWTCHFLPESVLRQQYSQSGMTKEKVPVRERKLFPEQVTPFPDAKLVMHYPAGEVPKNCTVHWTLYLEDAPSVSGVIDLCKAMTQSEAKTP